MTAILSDVYLSQVGQVILDANGNGLVVLAPSVGQYWRPSIVHVGSLTGSPVFCDLHVGAQPATQSGSTYSDPGSIKDSTPLGADDTSGILSGTVIFPGQAIIVHFKAGQVNDQCYAEIIGISSPVPPPYGNLPTIPGVRFAGSVFNPQSNHALLSINEGLTLAANTSVQAFNTPNNVINVDAFAYIALNISAVAGLNMLVNIGWAVDPTGLIQIASDQFSFLSGDQLEISIPVKSSYMSVQFTAAVGAGGIVNWAIAGSQVAYRAQLTDRVNILFQNAGGNVGVGATNTTDASVVMPGPAVFTAYSSTSGASFDVVLFAVHFDGTVIAIARGDNLHPLVNVPVYLPASHYRMQFRNDGAAGLIAVYMLNSQPIFP